MRVPYTDIKAEYMDTPERRVLDLRRDGLPDIPLLGFYRYSRSRPDLPLHRHLGTVEICLLWRGRQLFQVDDQQYQLMGGDVLVTLPDEPHSTAGEPSEPGILYWLNLRLPKRRPLLGLPLPDSQALIRALLALPRRHFPATPLLKTLFDRLLDSHDHAEVDLQPLRVREAMVQLLLEIVDASARHARKESMPMMSDVIGYIQSHLGEDFRLEDLARRAGYSLSRFKVRFKQETGMSPRQFIHRTKIEAARQRLLGGDDPVGKIALDLGFPTAQYFATVFRRYLGITPRGYRDGAARPHGPTRRREDQQG